MTPAVQAKIDQAVLARAEGRHGDARNAYAQAAALSRETGESLSRAFALRHLSDLDREAGKAVEALAHADQAVALYRRHGAAAPLDLANALRLAGLALQELGRGTAAIPLWTEARDAYAALGVADGVAECDARLAAISSPEPG